MKAPGLARLRDLCLALALLLAPLAIFAPIDHWVASLFYEGDGSFWLTGSWVGRAFEDVLRPAFYYVLAGLILALGLRSFRMRAHRRLTLRRLAYVLAVFGLGVGLATNLILKDGFDRPRPLQTTAYGGAAEYQPPILPTKGCLRNCSFVSGDAAAGFAMIALPIAFASGRRRRRLIVASLWLGGAVGLLRMMNGSHYLFDVIYAGFLNVWLSAALYPLMLRLDAGRLKALWRRTKSDAGEAGQALRRLLRRLRGRDGKTGGA